MQTHNYFQITHLLVLLGSLAACTSNQGSADPRPTPSYAAPILLPQGFQSWVVRCALHSIVGIDGRDKSIFYNSDGTAKSLTEFCDEYDPSTRIQNPR
jgi:hypothetical protein